MNQTDEETNLDPIDASNRVDEVSTPVHGDLKEDQSELRAAGQTLLEIIIEARGARSNSSKARRNVGGRPVEYPNERSMRYIGAADLPKTYRQVATTMYLEHKGAGRWINGTQIWNSDCGHPSCHGEYSADSACTSRKLIPVCR
ncbi:hypothetical protein R3P38DRAFT_2777476 [Favolaschia claudopus]|uniref:Uncharacterized protein n=1 Tax=Favolaschia claudopus TaxID=2862362 RepID=A0AAW0BKG0_9AGAR